MRTAGDEAAELAEVAYRDEQVVRAELAYARRRVAEWQRRAGELADELAEVRAAQRRRSSLAARVAAALAERPASAAQIAAQLGASRATVARVLSRLRDRGEAARVARGVWRRVDAAPGAGNGDGAGGGAAAAGVGVPRVGSATEAVAWALGDGEPRSLEEVARRLAEHGRMESPATLRRAAARLVERGWAQRTGRGVFQRAAR